MSGWALLLAGPPLVPLLLTLINMASWQRGRPGGSWARRVSLLVPARNEERTIERCLHAIADSAHPLHEIIVCDDQSTDATPQILARLTERIGGLRVIGGAPLPAGWVGKPHACHQLAEAATGDVLVFVDADTLLEPTAVERILSLLESEAADVVTAVPRQLTGSTLRDGFERLIVPLLLMTYTSWLPLFLVAKSRDPRFVAANGQLLAVRRRAYDRLGGFAAVAHEIVDDVAFCRHAKTEGAKVVFADGTTMARCRMYDSTRRVWEGFSKNIYEGIGGTLGALFAVVSLHLVVFVAPYVGLVLGLLGEPALIGPSLVGVGANVVLRSVLWLRYRQPPEGVILHPLGVIALCMIALNSYRWSAAGRLTWAGRTYGARKDRWVAS